MEITDASCSESKVTSSHNTMTTEVGVLDDFSVTRGKNPGTPAKTSCCSSETRCALENTGHFSPAIRTETATGKSQTQLSAAI